MIPSIDQLRERLIRHNPSEVDNPDARRAAVAVVISTSGSEPEFLLMKRVEREGDPWSGQVSFPGGHMDPGDSSLADTAIREAHEETGAVLPAPIAQLDDFHPTTKVLPNIVVRPFAFVVDDPVRTTPGPEATLVFQAGWTELTGSRKVSTVDAIVGLRTVFGYQVGPHFVWGLTERIITPLLSILRDS